MKPAFTEEQIEEISQLYHSHGYILGVHEVMEFLKEKLQLSNVHSTIIAIRKEFFGGRIPEKQKLHKEKYKNTGLEKKLIERIDFKDNTEG